MMQMIFLRTPYPGRAELLNLGCTMNLWKLCAEFGVLVGARSSERLYKIFQGAIMAQKISRTSDLNKGCNDRCGNIHACMLVAFKPHNQQTRATAATQKPFFWT